MSPVSKYADIKRTIECVSAEQSEFLVVPSTQLESSFIELSEFLEDLQVSCRVSATQHSITFKFKAVIQHSTSHSNVCSSN